MNAFIRLSLSLIGISLLTACGEEIDHNDIRQAGFVFCGQGKPTTFNPQLIDSGITAEALSPQLYDTLLTLDPKTHQPIASIAESWSVNKEGTEYTFKLKHGVQFQTTPWFSPTRPLNSKDVVFSFKRIIDVDHPFHQVGGGFYPWFAGLDFQNLLQDVIAVDDYTVTFKLAQPNFSFLANIATSHAVILSAEYGQQLAAKDNKEQIDQLPIGSGPYQLKEYQVNDLIRLERHPNYWNSPAKMEQVVFDISHRGTGTLAKLLRNECDVLSSPISSQIPIIQEDENLELYGNTSK